MVRSDHIESHKRQHERIYYRDDSGQFVKKSSSVRGTMLPSGVPSYRPGYQVISKNDEIHPSGVPSYRPGYHATELGTTKHRPGYQNKRSNTQSLSQSSFKDEEIPVFNFDPKLNSNMQYFKDDSKLIKKEKKSKHGKKKS